MVESAAELRATSDMLLLDLEALGQLEEQKRSIPHDDPRLVDLAARIEEIAQRVLSSSRRQRALTEVVTLEASAGQDDEPRTIDAMRSVSAILTDWREAERAAAGAPAGSSERAHAEALVERFRDEYREAFEAARQARG
ncbi:MAG TPA: hypothetical protein VNL94_09140 [Candidatus Binatia bacterium]|nr:hypothetical protein [Candidatus Binatia bacterium]